MIGVFGISDPAFGLSTTATFSIAVYLYQSPRPPAAYYYYHFYRALIHSASIGVSSQA